jgi:hypothetical protein
MAKHAQDSYVKPVTTTPSPRLEDGR